MSNTFSVGGRAFHWSMIFQTSDYEPLLHLIASEVAVDVLRISSEDQVFDIAVRVSTSSYAGGSKVRHLGPGRRANLAWSDCAARDCDSNPATSFCDG